MLLDAVDVDGRNMWDRPNLHQLLWSVWDELLWSVWDEAAAHGTDALLARVAVGGGAHDDRLSMDGRGACDHSSYWYYHSNL